jgi:hypothetical protein
MADVTARILVFLVPLLLLWGCAERPDPSGDFIELSADTLGNKIRGGLLGQSLGNLKGLKHEARYIDQPGDVTHYTPSLPRGARTDDDTDIEWVYVVDMQASGELFLPMSRITELWKAHINQRIWSSNQYVRQLMDIGIEPPLTGYGELNPWADFNISGQFLCEAFALIAPAMPQTAARLGLHYTRVGIESEPAQSTQMFAAMIATAFVTDDLSEILEAGLAAVDPKSEIRTIVDDVRRWHRENPEDWRTTRRLIKERYSRYDGDTRDANGYELNTACTVAALLYGSGDFRETVRIAFNLGWDCDNNAATAATIIGVIKGSGWMMDQGWEIGDRYRNTTRQGMPEDETITSFGDRLVDLADRVIVERGGERLEGSGRTVYRIRREEPSVIDELADPMLEQTRLRQDLEPEIRDALAGRDRLLLARAAYLAICLDLAADLQPELPDRWSRAVQALNAQQNILQVLFHQSPTPRGEQLRARAIAAGLDGPAEPVPVWTMDLEPRASELAADTSPLCIRVRRFAAHAAEGRQEADIDALIDSSFWLDRAAGEFADACGELTSITERAGSPDLDGEPASSLPAIRRLLDELRGIPGDPPAADDPLCTPLARQFNALEAAVTRRDADGTASEWERLRLRSRELQDLADSVAAGADVLRQGLALGSRQRVDEAIRELTETLRLP